MKLKKILWMSLSLLVLIVVGAAYFVHEYAAQDMLGHAYMLDSLGRGSIGSQEQKTQEQINEIDGLYRRGLQDASGEWTPGHPALKAGWKRYADFLDAHNRPYEAQEFRDQLRAL